MAPSTIRKAIGAVKDQTSIGLAKVASNTAPELEVAIVKATSHDDDPADEKYIREILNLTSYSTGYVNACVFMVSKRLGKTRDWIVALKALVLVHRLLADGDPVFQQEILYATRRGTRLLNMSDFRDEAHSHSWDYSAFVRTYSMYLDQRLECIMYERKQRGSGGEDDRFGQREDRLRSPPSRYDYDYGEFRDEPSYGGGVGGGGYGMRRSRSYGDVNESKREEKRPPTPLRDMKPERILGKMSQLQRLLDRFLASRPTGLAKNNRMVLIALYPIVKESFQLYTEICETLAVLLDKFFDMEYPDCVKSFEAYASAAKQIDELVDFYGWCKDAGVGRSSEFPEVQKITDKLLDTLEEFMRDRARRPKSPVRVLEETPPLALEEAAPNMNEIKALPPPENYTPPPPEPEPEPAPKPQAPPPAPVTQDLVDLRDDGVSAEDQSNRLALALFSGPVNGNANGSWEAFPSNGAAGEPEVTSAWQTPAAEPGKADWELALVETASNLTKQKATLAGGFDPLLLNGMYDQGIVRQHMSTAQVTGGSASSVTLPGPGKSATPVLALPAPDGTVQTVGQDPFAASLNFPPPSFVQMSDMVTKQQLLMQEQQLWQQYARTGMLGQASLAKISGTGYVAGPAPMMPYGMPPAVNGMGSGGYYYTPY
ncbi:probable clathrin assembly protein At4g32285 isoform X2 [Telopea speciosissima]|uniref:probable clathrin assembly protein At4g32285 isoform X2 n=1 Tax=Telopea speciosissima TaxID=54955 RepID=UPI001CC50A8B|nr:probable clathrin assembly protein At4g32285 isoform X2 [Telopea speciosissima]